MKYLLDNDADISISDQKGNTALHLASISGQHEIVQLLLSAAQNRNITYSTQTVEEYDINQLDSLGKTPLGWAQSRLDRLRKTPGKNIQEVQTSLIHIIESLISYLRATGKGVDASQIDELKDKVFNMKTESDLDEIESLLGNLSL